MSPSSPSPEASGGEALTDAALLAVDALLTAGAALRVTRFATTDVLGGWALSDPLHRWASRHEPGRPFGYLAPPEAWRHRLVSALDCPFCAGTQAALVIGAALAVTSSRTAPASSRRRLPLPRTSPLGLSLRAAAASLAAAYVVGHVSHRLDTPAPTSKDSK